MKRNLLYFAAGVLALSSCTSEDVVKDVARKQNVIGFENVVNKISRADDIINSGFKQFYVYGYYNTADVTFSNVFDNVLVSNTATGWQYYNETTNVDYQYWIPGAKYHFYAYSCGDAAKLEGITCSSVADGTSSFSLANYICDADHQVDLIFAYNSGSDNKGIVGKDNANQPVALNFSHILSKVNATFTSGFPKGQEVKISNVTIRNIADQGSFIFQVADGTPSYTWNASRVLTDAYVDLWKEETPISVSLTDDPESNSMDTNSAYVIPNKYNAANVTINFTIDVIDQGKVVLHKDLIGFFQPDWRPGFTYTYNIEVDGNAAKLDVIGFTTTVDAEGNIDASQWGNGDSSEIKFN